MSKLSTDPYKGVRDFYPEDMFLEKHIFDIWRKVAEKFGYDEYSASILEPSELYKQKSGEEIANEQTYNFIDRGDRNVTLRPEMTPTVARMVSARRRELGFPLRWYSIPNLFRYEQPQRGRLREHYQLNVDLFGAAGIQADIEIISIAHEIMREFGASVDDFEIRISNRELIYKKLELAGITDSKQKDDYISLLDKKEKMSSEEFQSKEIEIVGKNLSINLEEPDDYTQEILNNLEIIGISNAKFDPTLFRGFNYYTGMVFEIFDTNKENRRSLFGGGRYDNLTYLFDNESTPAVGFGMGDVTIRDFLETHDLLPKYKSTTDIYLIMIGEESRNVATSIASELRNYNLNVAIDISGRKIGDQIKTALKHKISNVLIVGEEEIKNQRYTLKNLATEKEHTVSIDEIAGLIQTLK